MVVKKTGMAKTAKFLDDIKDLGFKTAFKGGLSFNLGDIETPAEKFKIIKDEKFILFKEYNKITTTTEITTTIITTMTSISVSITDTATWIT